MAKLAAKVQFLRNEHHLGQNERVDESKAIRLVINVVLREDDGIVIREEREQQPKIKKYREKLFELAHQDGSPRALDRERRIAGGCVAHFAKLSMTSATVVNRSMPP